jgi:hypothetical protein
LLSRMIENTGVVVILEYMVQYYYRQLLSLLWISLSYALVMTFVAIISIQHLSVIQFIHAGSKTICSCGCQNEGADCGGDCCSSQSLSSCNCNEPHQTVVSFILPGTLDLFIQALDNATISPFPQNKFQLPGITCYLSLVLEPPVPVPIT